MDFFNRENCEQQQQQKNKIQLQLVMNLCNRKKAPKRALRTQMLYFKTNRNTIVVNEIARNEYG